MATFPCDSTGWECRGRREEEGKSTGGMGGEGAARGGDGGRAGAPEEGVGQVAHGGQELRSVAAAQGRAILPEGDIAHQEAALDGPMTPEHA